MRKKYNVVIIGAGPAGLECAYNLGNSRLNILLIEKKSVIGPKVCAGGFNLKDMDRMPRNLLDQSFREVIVYYHSRKIKITRSYPFLATIDRKNLGQYQLDRLRKFKNIEVRIGTMVKRVLSDKILELDNGERIEFENLVGADGALSQVRKYLKLPSKKLSIAIQYIVPKQFKKLEIFFDNKLWGTGYLWIFPHKNYDSIGCGTDINFLNIKKLKNNFNDWLKEQRIDIKNARFEAAPINCDYQGYKFNNIFLAGDAAGLTPAITREGIYPAILSGRQIALDILGMNKDKNIINEYLAKKRRQEKYLFIFKSPSFIKHLIFSLIFRFNNKQIQNKLKNIFIN